MPPEAVLTPGSSGVFFTDWIVLLGLAVVVVIGLAYLLVARPDRLSEAPSDDAVVVADELRRRTGAIRTVSS